MDNTVKNILFFKLDEVKKQIREIKKILDTEYNKEI